MMSSWGYDGILDQQCMCVCWMGQPRATYFMHAFEQMRQNMNIFMSALLVHIIITLDDSVPNKV